jgi:hypothetical protein
VHLEICYHKDVRMAKIHTSTKGESALKFIVITFDYFDYHLTIFWVVRCMLVGSGNLDICNKLYNMVVLDNKWRWWS